MPETLVIALGGNALLPPGHSGSIPDQRTTLHHSLAGISELLRFGHRVVITHGNGPQVGHIMVRNEAARGRAYDLPVDVAIAQSQGEMGYIIQQALRESFHRHGVDKPVVTVLTQVVVDRHDPGLKRATKPVGPWYDPNAVDELRSRGWSLVHDAVLGFRRVVPSPRPQRVVEMDAIRDLLHDGAVVIAGGGGGIPVFTGGGGALEGVEAVVDKDHTSALIAEHVRADRFLILTSVDRVRLNFQTPYEKPVDRLTISECNTYLDEGHFPEGNMRPKIEASVRFLEGGGKEAVIALPEKIVEAYEGRAGTHIAS